MKQACFNTLGTCTVILLQFFSMKVTEESDEEILPAPSLLL